MLCRLPVWKRDNSFNFVYSNDVIKRISYYTSGFSSELYRVGKSISPALTTGKLSWTAADLRLLEPGWELMLHAKQPTQNLAWGAPLSIYGKHREVHAPSYKPCPAL